MKAFYEDGRGQLFHGEALAIMRQMEDASIDAVITDPPYSSGGFTRGDRQQKASTKYQQTGTIKGYPDFIGDNRDARSWAFWCSVWISEAFRVMKDGAYFLMFTDWCQLPSATDAMQAGGMVWRGIVVWDKGLASRAPHKGYFRHQCEYIVWGTKGGMDIPTEGDGPWPGCFSIPIHAAEKQHMTAKPISLMAPLIQVIPPGGVVLDPFAGSGTTCVAAAMSGRRYIGVEYMEEYCKISAQRLSEILPDIYIMEDSTR